jgi:hypothetical protein
MLDDIVFLSESFILESNPTTAGEISAYSLDGANYDFTATGTGTGESSYTFVS